MGSSEVGTVAGGEAELRAAIGRYRRLRRESGEGAEAGAPGCVFGLMTRDAIDDLMADVEDVKAELKWVRATIIVTIVTAAAGTLARLAGLVP